MDFVRPWHNMIDTLPEHIPLHKQQELRKVLDIILASQVLPIHMVILFGSYARGDFVERDITIGKDGNTY